MYRENDLFSLDASGDMPGTGKPDELDVNVRASSAIAAIADVLRLGHRVKAGFSSGKDSSATVNLTLAAARSLIAAGDICPPIVIAHSDTKIESPIVRFIADSELLKIKTYAAEHLIPLTVQVAQPSLATGFAAKIIGARALPSYPTKSRECAIEWKTQPSKRLSKRIADSLPKGANDARRLVTVLGTRSDESIARGTATRKRGESAHAIWTNQEGDLMLSPILGWSSDDVFEYLGYCAAGIIESYSDFAQVIEFYADAGGSSCAVIGDITVQRNAKPCGARSGCYLCVASTDKSARTMIANEPDKYPYLVPLLRLRDFIAFTENDWSRRNYIARTIDDDGFIRIAADQFSPAMCEELLRYSLYAQSEANALGAPSRVSIVGIRELIAIDFFWSIRGLHPAFHALKIYFEHLNGQSQQAPLLLKPYPKSPVPELGKIYVGRDWDGDQCEALGATGLRDPIWEMFNESCGPTLKANRNGKLLLDLDSAGEFDVDVEGATLFLDFEAERMIEQWHRDDADWTAAASVYLRYGCVSLGKGMSTSVDKAIRRSQWRQRHALHGQRGQDELWKRCTSRVARQDVLFRPELDDLPLVLF